MTLSSRIQEHVKSQKAAIKESKGIVEFTVLVAERKAFLSTQKLQYTAKYRILDDQKTIHYFEMLRESGSGMSTGGDLDTPGFGFKTESYKTGSVGREGNIEQQSSLFGKKYEYQFDFKDLRSKIEEMAQEEGYQFQLKFLPRDV
jgi:hypothetical protein